MKEGDLLRRKIHHNWLPVSVANRRGEYALCIGVNWIVSDEGEKRALEIMWLSDMKEVIIPQESFEVFEVICES